MLYINIVPKRIEADRIGTVTHDRSVCAAPAYCSCWFDPIVLTVSVNCFSRAVIGRKWGVIRLLSVGLSFAAYFSTSHSCTLTCVMCRMQTRSRAVSNTLLCFFHQTVSTSKRVLLQFKKAPTFLSHLHCCTIVVSVFIYSFTQFDQKCLC